MWSIPWLFSRRRYRLFRQFTTTRDAVVMVRFSAFGDFLCACGYNGVACWDVATSRPVSAPLGYAPKPSHVYPACAWLYFEETSRHLLLLGNMKGRISAWDLSKHDTTFEHSRRNSWSTSETQTLFIAVAQTKVAANEVGRVAAAFGDGAVCVWTFPSLASHDIQMVWQISLDGAIIPKSISINPRSQEVYVFSATGGAVTLLTPQSGDVRWTRASGPEVMSSVDVDYINSRFTCWSGDHFELRDLQNITCIRILKTEPPIVHFPKHVAFGEGGSVIVAGSDRGKAIVYSSQSGKVLQNLPNPSGGLVQPIAVSFVQ
ncbi:WD40-repeat-containing domain protein [Cristinia sonorae]|uniref:WD40-repeat-containing domain protein n=1 Tax=Cristinia sonorae TaxID=1940300 RepID=A0A8K0UKD2_9AGAR|nr:WD40-repeat-containing domain protein [Cristinia sonorae]